MRFIIVTRECDGKKVYVNPEPICAIYQHYVKDSTVIQFADDENYIEILESVDTIASMVEAEDMRGDNNDD